MKIFALNNLEPMDDLIFGMLLEIISSEKQERIRKFAKSGDIKRVLMADVLVRYVIAEELKISNEKIEFGVNKYGKPFLKGNRNFHFNVSHSGDWIVCAADNKPVGIDVEKIGPVELEIAAQFFSDEEYKMLIAKSPEDRQNFFFDLWTLKESYIKAIGKGLSIPLKSFTINFPDKGEIEVKSGNKSTKWVLKQYNLDPEYKISVCATHQALPDEVIIKKLKDIYSELF